MPKSAKIETPLQRILNMRSPQWLVDHVEKWLEESQEARYDPGWFHPSSLSNPCDAFLAFCYKGVVPQSKPVSARLRRIFDNGHSQDRNIKEYLEACGLSLVEDGNRRIEIPHLCIRGEFDDLIANPRTGEKYVFEFKTMNRDEWKELQAPKEDHRIQVHPYMFATGVLQTYIVYECKNCQAWKPFIIKFDGGLWQSIEMRVNYIMQTCEAGKLPLRTPAKNDSQCQFYVGCSVWQGWKEQDASSTD